MIELLLAAGADLETKDAQGATPLHFAAGQNVNQRVLERLIELGADVDAREQAGATPLHAAASNSRSDEIVAFLIAAGADVNARTRDGQSVLDVSKYQHKVVLREAGARRGKDLEAR